MTPCEPCSAFAPVMVVIAWYWVKKPFDPCLLPRLIKLTSLSVAQMLLQSESSSVYLL